MKTNTLSDEELKGYIFSLEDTIDNLQSSLKIYREALIWRRKFKD